MSFSSCSKFDSSFFGDCEKTFCQIHPYSIKIGCELKDSNFQKESPLWNTCVSESLWSSSNFKGTNDIYKGKGISDFTNNSVQDISVHSCTLNQRTCPVEGQHYGTDGIKLTSQSFIEENQLKSLCSPKILPAYKLSSHQLDNFDFKQYALRNNLEIVGVPYVDGENLYLLLKLIARVIQVPFRREEVSVARIWPLSKCNEMKITCHPFIVVNFNNNQVKGTWRKASRETPIKASDLMAKFPTTRVFLNDHLTSHNKAVLGRARNYVCNGKLAFAWTSNCKMLVKKCQNSVAVRVYSMEDVDAIALSQSLSIIDRNVKERLESLSSGLL